MAFPDTGPLAPAGTYNVIVKATLPTNAGAGPLVFQPKATSQADPTKSATGTDTLTAVATGSVDLTNNTAGSGAPGFGVGPEGSAAVTNPVTPGGTSRFTIVIANGSCGRRYVRSPGQRHDQLRARIAAGRLECRVQGLDHGCRHRQHRT